jgi:hypothetical protein
MLFTFNKFWKNFLLLASTWAFYGLWGFELTTITLLGFILASIWFNEQETP